MQDPCNGVGHMIFRSSPKKRIYSAPMKYFVYEDDGKTKVKSLPDHPPIRDPYIHMSRLPTLSCNGIIVIPYSETSDVWSLWNPLTGESHELPRFENIPNFNCLRGFSRVCGLGYDFDSHDYKIVRISQQLNSVTKNLVSEAAVYSLNLGSWRRIKNPPHWLSRWSRGVFLNGALHWTGRTDPQMECEDVIVAFDLGTEDYRLLPFPYKPKAPRYAKIELGVLDGCLSLNCCEHEKKVFDVWFMKGYGVENSWIKLFTMRKGDDVERSNWETEIDPMNGLKAISYSKRKGLAFMQFQGSSFFWFDIETRKKRWVSGPDEALSSEILVRSIVRLNRFDGAGARRSIVKENIVDETNSSDKRLRIT